MRKISLALVFSLIGFLYAEAQVEYPTQPVAGYYEDLKKLVIPSIPSETTLINIKQGAIPVNFKDTLYKYDWYEIASYYFYEKEYSSYFLDDLEGREKIQASNQFNFFRYTPKGIRYEMSMHRYKDGSMKVNTTTFDENNATKFVEIKKVGTKTMLVVSNYGESEMIEIVSYANGVMVLIIKQYPNATTKRYHIAYRAVSKTF